MEQAFALYPFTPSFQCAAVACAENVGRCRYVLLRRRVVTSESSNEEIFGITKGQPFNWE